MSKQLLWLVALLFVVGNHGTAFAKTSPRYLLFSATGTEGHTELKESFNLLLFSELERRGASVTQAETSCDSAECVALTASNFEPAMYGILVRLVTIEERYQFHLNLVSIKKERVVFSTATNKFTTEGIDVAAANAATSIISKKGGRRTTGSSDTSGGAEESDRHTSLLYGGSGGATFPMNGIGGKEARGLFELGFLMEIHPIGVEVTSGYRFNKAGATKTDEYTADLGIRYYFGDQIFVPFATGMVGARYQKSSGVISKWGVATGAGLGISLLRSEKFEIPITVRYEHDFYTGLPDSDQVLGTVGIYIIYN